MFSFLNPISGTTTPDKDKHRQSPLLGSHYRDNRRKTIAQNTPSGETVSISIDALILYLEDALVSQDTPYNAPPPAAETLSAWTRSQSMNDNTPAPNTIQSRMATNAYARTVQHYKQKPASNINSDTKAVEDTYQLINDLRLLRYRGIETIDGENYPTLMKKLTSVMNKG